MRETIITTTLHIAEFTAVILGGAIIVKVFNLQGEDLQYLISIILYALSVFARKSPSVPLKDWVNPER